MNYQKHWAGKFNRHIFYRSVPKTISKVSSSNTVEWEADNREIDSEFYDNIFHEAIRECYC